MIDKHYNQFFEVYTVSSSVDTYNIPIETMVVKSSAFGYLEPLGGNQRYLSDKWKTYTTHRLFSPVISISGNDEVHINSEVYVVDLVENHREHHLQTILIKRK